jgi:MFS family permease
MEKRFTGRSEDQEAKSSPARPGSTTFRALKHRNFRLFFAGQLVSLIGTWMQNVAQSWLVYRLTGSPLLLGLVAFAGQAPVLLLAPVGGAVADRRSRRDILIATQSASMTLAFVLAGLTLSGIVRPWQVFVLAALLAVVNAFDIPARQAFIAEMVGPQDLANAIALNSSMFNGARVVGPAAAGVLVATLGEGWCFFVNGISFVAVIAGLAAMRLPERPPRAPAAPLWSHLAGGFRFVARTAPVRGLLLLLGVIGVTGMPYAVLMPVFADDILHVGARGLGVLMGGTGVGALIGALVLATRQTLRGLGRWVSVAAASFGVALALFSLSRTFWLSAVLLVPVGGAMMVQMAASNTLVQSMVPDELRGRVIAIYAMTFMGTAPLGALIAGAAASRVGAPLTVAAGGFATLGAAGYFATRWPAMREEARRLVAGAMPIVSTQLVAGDPVDEMTGTEIADESTR